MFQRLLDFALNFVARHFFGAQDHHKPVFDLDDVFDRLGDAGDRFLARLQRVMVGFTAALIAGILALAVLTVRIYQLSAGYRLEIFGTSFDGALVFGFVLAVFAAGFGSWVFREQNADLSLQSKRERERREALESAPPPRAPSSPLEDALAAFIMHRLQDENRAATAAPAQTGVVAEEKREPETVWNPAHTMSTRPAHDRDEHPLA